MMETTGKDREVEVFDDVSSRCGFGPNACAVSGSISTKIEQKLIICWISYQRVINIDQDSRRFNLLVLPTVDSCEFRECYVIIPMRTLLWWWWW